VPERDLEHRRLVNSSAIFCAVEYKALPVRTAALQVFYAGARGTSDTSIALIVLSSFGDCPNSDSTTTRGVSPRSISTT
jgi:hypothetical protein